MGVVCNDRCLCSDIIIIYLPELFAFSASRFRQTIQAGIYCIITTEFKFHEIGSVVKLGTSKLCSLEKYIETVMIFYMVYYIYYLSIEYVI